MKNRINSVLKFISIPIFSLFVTLTSSYSMNLIYLIGDSRLLLPLFSGILIGTLLFAISGSFFKKYSFVSGIIIAMIAIILANYVIYITDMVINSIDLFLVSLLVTSPIMPISQFFEYGLYIKKKLVYSIAASIIFIALITIFAFLYEMSGQTILPLGISIFGYASLIIFLIMIFKRDEKNGK